MNILFKTQRSFKVWRYLVSHGQLLLRSVPTDMEPLRIEVLFKGVYAMKMTTELKNFSIREPSNVELSRIGDEIGTPVSDLGLTAFVIESGSSAGFVVASGYDTAKDDGNYKTPSTLLIGM